MCVEWGGADSVPENNKWKGLNRNDAKRENTEVNTAQISTNWTMSECIIYIIISSSAFWKGTLSRKCY